MLEEAEGLVVPRRVADSLADRVILWELTAEEALARLRERGRRGWPDLRPPRGAETPNTRGSRAPPQAPSAGPTWGPCYFATTSKSTCLLLLWVAGAYQGARASY